MANKFYNNRIVDLIQYILQRIIWAIFNSYFIFNYVIPDWIQKNIMSIPLFVKMNSVLANSKAFCKFSSWYLAPVRTVYRRMHPIIQMVVLTSILGYLVLYYIMPEYVLGVFYWAVDSSLFQGVIIPLSLFMNDITCPPSEAEFKEVEVEEMQDSIVGADGEDVVFDKESKESEMISESVKSEDGDVLHSNILLKEVINNEEVINESSKSFTNNQITSSFEDNYTLLTQRIETDQTLVEIENRSPVESTDRNLYISEEQVEEQVVGDHTETREVDDSTLESITPTSEPTSPTDIKITSVTTNDSLENAFIDEALHSQIKQSESKSQLESLLQIDSPPNSNGLITPPGSTKKSNLFIYGNNECDFINTLITQEDINLMNYLSEGISKSTLSLYKIITSSKQDAYPPNSQEYTQSQTFKLGASKKYQLFKSEQKFKEYCPKIMKHIRQLNNIDDSTYSKSFQKIVLTKTSAGYTYYSNDKEFILKPFSRQEFMDLKSSLPIYYNHLVSYPDTSLPRYCGFYKFASTHFVSSMNTKHSPPSSATLEKDSLLSPIYWANLGLQNQEIS